MIDKFLTAQCAVCGCPSCFRLVKFREKIHVKFYVAVCVRCGWEWFYVED